VQTACIENDMLIQYLRTPTIEVDCNYDTPLNFVSAWGADDVCRVGNDIS
jgi:hypothetical protein